MNKDVEYLLSGCVALFLLKNISNVVLCECILLYASVQKSVVGSTCNLQF